MKLTRYVFVSDIHGQFDKLAEALAGAKFDQDIDTLVCLGDIFDRGPQSLEVLEYLMSLPNRIFIWGNHDYRVRQLLCGGLVGSHDYSNGVLETLHSFCPDHKNIKSIDFLINIFSTHSKYEDTYRLLWKYFDECVWAVEWENLIATHAWLPHCGTIPARGATKTQPIFQLRSDWRNSSRADWYEASWAHTEQCIEDKIFPDKTLIIGHWHAWRLWAKFGGYKPNYAPWETYNHFEGDDLKVICIDGCSNADGGVVNACVLQLEEDYNVYY